MILSLGRGETDSIDLVVVSWYGVVVIELLLVVESIGSTSVEFSGSSSDSLTIVDDGSMLITVVVLVVFGDRSFNRSVVFPPFTSAVALFCTAEHSRILHKTRIELKAVLFILCTVTG